MPCIGPSNSIGAAMPESLNPAVKVVVLQWPCGIDARQRVPLGDQPRNRAILVLAPFAIGTRTSGVPWLTVNKYQPLRVELDLPVEPVLAPGLDIRTLLLCRVPRLFLCVRPRFDRKYQIVVG